MTKQENIIRWRARGAIRRALKRREIERPSKCQKCNKGGRTSDGRAFIHAHHYRGYEYPLAVRWLCPSCHFKIDLRYRGERNGNAKLTEADVLEIRNRQPLSMKALGRKYGVSDRTIKRILVREVWSYL